MICDTRDFGIGRRLNTANWKAPRAVGDRANQRLCDAQAADAQPAPDVMTLEEVTQPTTTADGHHAAGLRFGDPRVMALLAAITSYTHVLNGFTNAGLTQLVATLLDHPYYSRQATYDLRRVRRKGLIERLPGTHRYQVTPAGRAIAVLFTKTHGGVLGSGLTALHPSLPNDLDEAHGKVPRPAHRKCPVG